MAVKVSTFEEVSRLIAGNPLRNFPTPAKGRDRLFPYARPRVTGVPHIPAKARFFLIGACFARSLGKALVEAGREVLSVQSEEDVPGAVQEQFNRYNVFNLDVGMNEVKWALNAHEVPIEAALVELRGQWIDSQKHWAFAYPRGEAIEYRRAYNRTYEGVAEADVVILALASHRQWFDNEAGIYINTMPARNLTSAYPGRFEMHEFDPDAAADRLRAAVDTINRLCRQPPQILVCISPVWQAMSLTAGDSLSDQIHSRSVQRVATEKVVPEYANVHYLPALEAALLGDFDLNFIANNPTHNTQNLADRVIADFLEDASSFDETAKRLSVRAHAQAALALGDPASAVSAISTYKDLSGLTVVTDPHLARLYTTSLRRVGRKNDAVAEIIAALDESEPVNRPEIWKLALEFAVGSTPDQQAQLRDVAQKRGCDVAGLDEATRERTDEERELRHEIAQFNAAAKAGRFDEAIHRSQQLQAQRTQMNRRQRCQFDIIVLRVMLKARGDRSALDYALSLTSLGENLDPDFIFQTAMIASNGQNPDQLEALVSYVEALDYGNALHPSLVRAKARFDNGRQKAARRASAP